MGIKSLTTLFISTLILSLTHLSSAQTCTDYTFTNRAFTTCTSLPYLSSFLHWTYHQSNSTVDIAYRHTNVDTSTWVAWALNIEKTQMDGAQSLVAYHNSSGAAHAYTSALNTGYSTQLAASDLSFQVPSISAEYVGSVMVIYATLVLPTGQTEFNQVWQSGPMSGVTPQEHTTSGDNMKSYGTVNFISGVSSSGGGGGSLQRRRNVHGVLNAVSWGTLMPLGAMIARYLKVFKSADPAWFYLHIACQSSAYIVGVAGWATGLKLGSDSGITHSTHRNIGITLFALGTLQVFALLLRPKKDHKIRIYWNVYHWAVGYLTIILSIVNIFEGLDILNPHKNWKRAYIAIIIFLGSNAAMLEAYTWYLVMKRKKTGSDKNPNGSNGVNGYGNNTRSQQAV